tara:strand:+ start:1005 stop:1184 length:180 start_codon:yes stop_codon:yes gene_type:complete
MEDMTLIHLYDKANDVTHEMYSILDAEDFIEQYPSSLSVFSDNEDVIQYLNYIMEVLND